VTIHREVFIFDRVGKGWTPENAALVAWAIHPFNNELRPPRRLEKEVRSLMKSFARSFGRTTNQFECAEAARETLQAYIDIANRYDDAYAPIWTEVLGGPKDTEDESDDTTRLRAPLADKSDGPTGSDEKSTKGFDYIAKIELSENRVDELGSKEYVDSIALTNTATQAIATSVIIKVNAFSNAVSTDLGDLLELDTIGYYIMSSAFLLGIESLGVGVDEMDQINETAGPGKCSIGMLRVLADPKDCSIWVPGFSKSSRDGGVSVLAAASNTFREIYSFNEEDENALGRVLMDLYGSGLRLAYLLVGSSAG
jgi:hypothetical protein